MLTQRDERQELLSDLDLAQRQHEAYKADRFISRENIIAVQQQVEILQARLAALRN